MSIMINAATEIQIIRRTSFTHKRPKDTDPFNLGKPVVGNADDVYDFKNPAHRKDLFALIIKEYDQEHQWQGDMETLKNELSLAIKEYKDSLPF